MAITDLTNTKWVFNDVLDTEEENITYSLIFLSNNENFTLLRLYNDSSYPNQMWYRSSTSIYVYENGWSLPLYKTILITGGTAATNSTFITWLLKNAVLDTGVLGVWKFNWTLDMTTYDWNTFDINFTAPYAGDTFKTLALTGIRTEGDYNPAGTDRLYYISSDGLIPVYNNTELTYKWENSGARVIFISGGDHVYSDALLDFLEPNATLLFLDNISDLTNTTWEFYNDLAIPSYSSLTTYNLDFTCNFNGTELTCNRIIIQSGGTQINYYCTSPQEYEGGLAGVFTVARGWLEEGFRTINITGGSNAATAAAILFILLNAKQILTYTTTDKELGSIADAIREKGSTTELLVYPDGFVSAILNILGGDIYEPIYKSLAYRSMIASSAPGVSEWCNSLSSFTTLLFAGLPFSGDFTFNNIKYINYYAFGSVNAGVYGGTYSFFGLNFPSCSSIYAAAFVMNQYLQSVSFPECTTIENSAFLSCTNLTTISFPKCTSIGSSAFSNCSNLTTISFPKCTSIGSYAFSNCRNLITISFPECTTIGNSAFSSCRNLTTISFPECTTIGNCAFLNCSNLTTISFPKCTSIRNLAFLNCSSLTTISFPSCTSIGSSAFYNCTNLNTVSFPECTYIGTYAFYSCANLTTLSSPECITIGNSAFYSCSNLTTISFSKCTSIGTNAFYNCRKLESAYFMGSSIPSIGTYIFANTPMGSTVYLGYYGSIYVPSSLLASYKTATNWATYSSRMVGI